MRICRVAEPVGAAGAAPIGLSIREANVHAPQK
jgi:hypothetical protein